MAALCRAVGVGGLVKRRSGVCNPLRAGRAAGAWERDPRQCCVGKGPERVCPKKFSPFAQIQLSGKGMPEGGVQRGKLAGKTGFASHRPPRSVINGMMGSAILPDTVRAGVSGVPLDGSDRAWTFDMDFPWQTYTQRGTPVPRQSPVPVAGNYPAPYKWQYAAKL